MSMIKAERHRDKMGNATWVLKAGIEQHVGAGALVADIACTALYCMSQVSGMLYMPRILIVALGSN